MDKLVWGPITPLNQAHGPDFPVEALPAPLREYTESLRDALQVPADLPAMLMLATAAVPLAKRVRIVLNTEWSEPTNLYTAVVLPPGSRKSAAFSVVTAPLEAWEKQQAELAAEAIANAKQTAKILSASLKEAEKRAAKAAPEEQAKLIQEAKSISSLIPPIPAKPRLLADDVTPERLVGLLAENGGRIALMSAEGGAFEMMSGRYSNSVPNLDVYLKGHAGDRISADRIGREAEIVEAPALTLALTVQPEVLRGLASKPGFRGRGLTPRFLFSIPRTMIGYREIETPPIAPYVKHAYHERITAL